MNNSGKKKKYIRDGLMFFAVMVLCCTALVATTHILFPGVPEGGIAEEPVKTEDVVDVPSDNIILDTVDGTFAILAHADISADGPVSVTENLFSDTAWGPGTTRTESLSVCNFGTAPLNYELLLYVISDDSDFIIPEDLSFSLSGAHTIECALSDANAKVVAASNTQIQPGEARFFDITLSLPTSSQKGCDPFSVCLILGARDETGYTVCSFTGDRMDYVPLTVPSDTEILLNSVRYTFMQQSGNVQFGLKFTGKDDTTVVFNDGYEADGLTVYMKDCIFYNLNLYLPVGCVFENCDFRTENYMNITSDVTANFTGCRFDNDVVVYVPNQEAGIFLEFRNCENEPVVVKR